MGTNAQISEDLDVADRVVSALRAALGDRLRAIVVFGSRARGDFHPESDWDFLVLAEGLPERYLERRQAVHDMLPLAVRGRTSIIAKTPEEFEERFPELYLDIALDGRILHDVGQYVEERLAQLRTTMERAGLYRERTPYGLLWRWRTPPGGPWSIEWER